jgi:hypothetical protein
MAAGGGGRCHNAISTYRKIKNSIYITQFSHPAMYTYLKEICTDKHIQFVNLKDFLRREISVCTMHVLYSQLQSQGMCDLLKAFIVSIFKN